MYVLSSSSNKRCGFTECGGLSTFKVKRVVTGSDYIRLVLSPPPSSHHYHVLSTILLSGTHDACERTEMQSRLNVSGTFGVIMRLNRR